MAGISFLYYKFGLTPKEEKAKNPDKAEPRSDHVQTKGKIINKPTQKPVPEQVKPNKLEKPRTVTQPTPGKKSIVMNSTTLVYA